MTSRTGTISNEADPRMNSRRWVRTEQGRERFGSHGHGSQRRHSEQLNGTAVSANNGIDLRQAGEDGGDN